MLAILCLLFTSVNIIASQETDLTNINNVASQIPKQASSYIAQANIDYALLDEIDKQVLVLMGKGDLLSARQLINQSIDATDFSRSPRSLVNRLLIRATLDRDVGANISALQDLQFAFRLSASTSQQDLVADVAYTIASIHQSRNEHSIALSYVQQALDKYKKQGADNKVTSSMLLA
ncbi:MAG: tetratricopeptide (TPR) repeat protein, partial [Glaciecola sp.]